MSKLRASQLAQMLQRGGGGMGFARQRPHSRNVPAGLGPQQTSQPSHQNLSHLIPQRPGLRDVHARV